MHHTDLCLNALIELKAAQCTLKSFQELPSSSSDSSRFYPPCQGTWNVLDTRVKWQHPHSAFLLWIGWTALTISFTFCCVSPLLSTSVAPSIRGTAVTILFVSENCLAMQGTSIVISTTSPYCWPTLFSQLQAAFKNTPNMIFKMFIY